jgi:putative Ca2+/H+ antiporter (TMEM165/GDT1 family)
MPTVSWLPEVLQSAITIFVVVFLVELPDKTALATVVLASRFSALPVLIGVALAFALQSIQSTSARFASPALPSSRHFWSSSLPSGAT